MFSPRPWGWSAGAGRHLEPLIVLPTPVGMVRSRTTAGRGRKRSPHARGDGPAAYDSGKAAIEFSPRPWGWSGLLASLRGNLPVLPTPVGMVRRCAPACVTPRSSPHARGDGPSDLPGIPAPMAFSPRPWGWSDSRPGAAGRGAVLPTPVGMVRYERALLLSLDRSPHARGDGPVAAFYSIAREGFSPRPWGWSVLAGQSFIAGAVLPTPVGMVRRAARAR